MIGGAPLGSRPLGTFSFPPPSAAPPLSLASNTIPQARRVTLVEVTAASTAPVVTALRPPVPLGGAPMGSTPLGGARPPLPSARPETVLRASDIGFVSLAVEGAPSFLVTEGGAAIRLEDDSGALQLEQSGATTRATPWRPILEDGLAVDRALNLLPTASAAGAAWGRLRLNNMDRSLTSLVDLYSPAGRALTVRWGYKAYDAARDYETDPPLAQLGTLFAGVGAGWDSADRAVEITLRDATWFAERALQTSLYGGTGGLEGPPELAGQPKPKLRGGSAAAPVRDIEPVLVDPVNLIYQINDARALITALYESGDGTRIPFQANVSDLSVGTTNAGEYRTDSARGLFQLGREPAGRITVDAYGATLGDNLESNPALLALTMLYEDLGVPPAFVEQSSFIALAPAWPYVAGWYWREPVASGLDAVALLLSSINAAIIPRRDGRLGAVPMAPPRTPVARYTDAELIEPGVVPVRLPDLLSPRPWRWRVGHTRCHTPQTTGLPDTLDAARTQFLAAEDRVAAWISADILAAFPRGNDPAPIVSAHLTAAGGQALADALGGLWGTRRALYDVTLPLPLAARHELGETLLIVSDAAGFEAGRAAVIVGERLRTQDDTATLRVMA